jgi:hypothetical protein
VKNEHEHMATSLMPLRGESLPTGAVAAFAKMNPNFAASDQKTNAHGSPDPSDPNGGKSKLTKEQVEDMALKKGREIEEKLKTGGTRSVRESGAAWRSWRPSSI